MKRNLPFLLVALAFVILAVAISPKILAKTETVQFCGSCHVMEEEYLALMRGGLHNSLRCTDCHLPHDTFVSFYFWKGLDGTKDVVFFYSGKVPETIYISEKGKGVVKQNCIRCHESTVSLITLSDRTCWDCHRSLSHRQVGLRETIQGGAL